MRRMLALVQTLPLFTILTACFAKLIIIISTLEAFYHQIHQFLLVPSSLLAYLTLHLEPPVVPPALNAGMDAWREFRIMPPGHLF